MKVVAEYRICDLVKLNLLTAYPIWFIEKFVKILVVQLKSGSEFEKKCIVQPYISGVYERVSSHLKKYMIDCVPRSNNNLSHVIIKGKYKVENHVKNNAVYKVDCVSCKYSYVKKTKKVLRFCNTCNKHPTISNGKALNCLMQKRIERKEICQKC